MVQFTLVPHYSHIDAELEYGDRVLITLNYNIENIIQDIWVIFSEESNGFVHGYICSCTYFGEMWLNDIWFEKSHIKTYIKYNSVVCCDQYLNYSLEPNIPEHLQSSYEAEVNRKYKILNRLMELTYNQYNILDFI
tara:strand:+ start:208 stop:615 length:408 start_codon:yes stop_codon:yes gene_type:complete